MVSYLLKIKEQKTSKDVKKICSFNIAIQIEQKYTNRTEK